jgi:hypothetical protein
MAESEIDWRMIGALEGNARDGYVPCRGGVPLGASGVTIGMGCDLGALDRKALDALGLPQPLEDALAPYLSRKGVEAQAALAASPLHLAAEDVDRLNAAVQSAHVEALRRAYDRATGTQGARFDDLPAAAQTVIASVKLQWGNIWSARHKSAAVRAFWRAAVARDWRGMEAVLRGWTPATYKTRRDKEADHLAAAIAARKDAQAVASDGASVIASG